MTAGLAESYLSGKKILGFKLSHAKLNFGRKSQIHRRVSSGYCDRDPRDGNAGVLAGLLVATHCCRPCFVVV